MLRRDLMAWKIFFCSFLAGAIIETVGEFSFSISGMRWRYFVEWLPIAI